MIPRLPGLGVVIAVFGALVVATLLLAATGAPPFEAMRLLVDGSIGSKVKLADTTMVWVPIVLASAGLVVTFACGLWNIGVEGQIVMGAIAASGVAIGMGGPGLLVIVVAIFAGAVAGMLWGLLAGVLKTRGGVNEIFGGLGLDFVAAGLAIYLIIGPWKREGIASTSGTDPFRVEVWFPTIGGTRFAPLAAVLAIGGVIAVLVLMRRTRLGLRLRAVGLGPGSAARLGVSMERHILGAFAICGLLAGLAGVSQALAFQHKLVPSISGAYGFLAILVVLLAARRLWAIVPIAFFFAAIGVGSSQLELRLDLDSSIGGVFQGVLVLAVLIAGAIAVQRRLTRETG